MEKHIVISTLLISLLGVINSQNVWLKPEFHGYRIRFKCLVDNLKNEVKIKGPNAYSGGYYCRAPIRTTGKVQGTCSSKNMTQDLTTNITSVSINITSTIAVSGTWICEHGSNTGRDSVEIDIRNWKPSDGASIEPSYCKNVCLKYTVDEDLHLLRLSCNVGLLEKKIIFKHPSGNVYGECLSPIWTQMFSGRCDKTIFQDLKTNTTTAEIPTAAQTLNGLWTCQHGEDGESNTVHVHMLEENECTGPIGCCVVFVLLLVALVVIQIINYKFDIMNKILRELQSRKKGYNKIPCQDGTKVTCEECQFPTVCVCCYDCRTFLCPSCCNQHIQAFGHNIFDINHPCVQSSKTRPKCDKCLNDAVQICLECVSFLCSTCHCQHPMQNTCIISTMTDQDRNDGTRNRCTNQVLVLKKKIELPKAYDRPIRVCGISILSDCRIVIADYNNKQLILFKDSIMKKEEKLKHEPRGLTSVFSNRIAVTIAELKEIRVYNILDENMKNHFQVLNTFSTSDIGKPYSIAYNDDHYVVEIGKSEQGVFGIFNDHGECLNRISLTNKIALFTGETIRIGLHWAKRIIFVSALGMKRVLCLDFKGNVKWDQLISSPRSIIFVPVGQSKQLLLASKRFNSLYQMSSENGNFNIIKLPDGVNGPRFMAYHATNQLLVVSADEGIFTFEYNMAMVS